MLAGVSSPVEREIYLGKIQELTGVDATILKAQVKQKTSSSMRETEKEHINERMRKNRGYQSKANPDKAKFMSSAAKEESILGILLLCPEYLQDTKTRVILDPEKFSCEFCRRVLSTLLEKTQDHVEFDFAQLNEIFSPEEMSELEGMKRRRAELENNTPAVLAELFGRLAEEIEKKKVKLEPLSTEWLKKIKAEKIRKE